MKRIFALVALAASSSFAQGGMPQPPAELSVEKWFVGSWSCKGHQNEGAMGPAMDTNNKIEFKMELMGFWLQYKGTAQAGPMKGKEIFDGFASWDGTQHVRTDYTIGGVGGFTP